MRKILLIIFLFVLNISKSQMCNTAPTNMGAITPLTAWTNVAANLGAKRYWTFNATAGCTYDFSSCNGTNTNDTYLRLYSGISPLTAILQTSNDDFGVWCTGSTKASLSWACTVSGAYSILLTNYSCANLSQNSIFSYKVTCPVIPSNNNCSGAIAIGIPYTSPVTSNNGATDDVPTSISGCGTQGSNIWYKVVGNNNQLTATTCNASTNFDTEVRVYTGTCSSLNSMVEIGCNDDDGACAAGILKSTVTWCSLSGTTYYISVGYFASGAGYGNFVLSVTNGAVCSVLPIELIQFEGQNKDIYNYISWVTANEINNNYFILERSIDGENWSIINTQTGAGTSNAPKMYEHKDYYFDKNNINYYKLSQVDFNNQKTYFNVIAIDFKKQSTCEIYEYYDLLGKKINIQEVIPGIYLRKCNDKIEKFIKN